MVEPLFWNPLPSAAEWLAQRTGRPMDARALVDTVAKMGKMGDPAPTVIRAMLPKNTNCASLSMFGKPALLPETDGEKFTRDRLAKQFGPLPNGVAYLGFACPNTNTLCVNNLLELLMRGEFTTGVLLETNPSDSGMVWLMPWGTEHTATMETCGINRADLMALGDLLAPTEAVDTAPETNAAKPAPVVPVSDATTDPERRLALLRALGGTAKYSRGEWRFTGISALVESEKGRKRSTEKTIRDDLKEAAQNERDAGRAGFATGLGQR